MAEPATPKPPNISDRVLTLEGKVDAMQRTLSSIENKLDVGALTQKGDRRYTWGVVIGVVGTVLAPALTTISVTLGLYVSNRLGPMETTLASMNARLDGYQRTQDRNFERIGVTEQDLATEKATRKSQIVEIETQFHALSESTNMAVAELHRWNAVAAEKPGASKYPAGPFVFPNISNRHSPKD